MGSECVLDIGMDLWSQDKEMVRRSSVTLLTHSTQACNIFQWHSVHSHWILCRPLADILGGRVSTETKPSLDRNPNDCGVDFGNTDPLF